MWGSKLSAKVLALIPPRPNLFPEGEGTARSVEVGLCNIGCMSLSPRRPEAVRCFVVRDAAGFTGHAPDRPIGQASIKGRPANGR